MVTKENQEYNW